MSGEGRITRHPLLATFSFFVVPTRHVTCSENKLTAKAAKSAKKNKPSLRALCVLRGKIFMVMGVSPS